ncbi:hypothetical protein CLCAR_3807 [Clostridium carboxidivorans P7]|nr:hypothetical protein CLCAR_3807 [Clostridium carboxidivorans P7]
MVQNYINNYKCFFKKSTVLILIFAVLSLYLELSTYNSI